MRVNGESLVTTLSATGVETMVRIPSTPVEGSSSMNEWRVEAKGETTSEGTRSKEVILLIEDTNNELGVENRPGWTGASRRARGPSAMRVNGEGWVTTLHAAGVETMIRIPSTPTEGSNPVNERRAEAIGETAISGALSEMTCPPVADTNNEEGIEHKGVGCKECTTFSRASSPGPS